MGHPVRASGKARGRLHADRSSAAGRAGQHQRPRRSGSVRPRRGGQADAYARAALAMLMPRGTTRSTRRRTTAAVPSVAPSAIDRLWMGSEFDASAGDAQGREVRAVGGGESHVVKESLFQWLRRATMGLPERGERVRGQELV